MFSRNQQQHTFLLSVSNQLLVFYFATVFRSLFFFVYLFVYVFFVFKNLALTTVCVCICVCVLLQYFPAFSAQLLNFLLALSFILSK